MSDQPTTEDWREREQLTGDWAGLRTRLEERGIEPWAEYTTGFWSNLDGGFDTRRSVRLYRNRVTPETEFDDSQRQGVRLGLTLQSKVHFRAALDARSNDGGSTSDESASYSANFGVSSFTSQNFGVRRTQA